MPCVCVCVCVHVLYTCVCVRVRVCEQLIWERDSLPYGLCVLPVSSIIREKNERKNEKRNKPNSLKCDQRDEGNYETNRNWRPGAKFETFYNKCPKFFVLGDFLKLFFWEEKTRRDINYRKANCLVTNRFGELFFRFTLLRNGVRRIVRFRDAWSVLFSQTQQQQQVR